MNDDVKMYRAKKDYEFTQQMIENQQKKGNKILKWNSEWAC